MQKVPSSYPCPIRDRATNCTLFAATDASWEALASFVGMSVSRFEQSPIITSVRCSPIMPDAKGKLSAACCFCI